VAVRSALRASGGHRSEARARRARGDPSARRRAPILDGVEAAFFDLDKTVIAKASMLAFGRPLHRAGYISRWLVLRALYGQVVYRYLGADAHRMDKMRKASLRIAKGWHRDTVAALVRETLTEVIEPIVYAEALELMRMHRDAGRRVFIVSSSPEEIVIPLAGYLGVDEAIASRAEIDDDGRYTGGVELYAYGPSKATAMREAAARDGIDLAASYAYSDSATDIPMLEVVGHAVAVNPDRELRRAAAARGWEVRNFERPVALRSRVPVPPKGPTIAIGSATIALTALGAASWWLLRRDRRRGSS
jgi:HAD superfamily hydrolase (TIGR01490 family)